MRHPWKAWWQTCHLGYFRGNIVYVNIPSQIMRKQNSQGCEISRYFNDGKIFKNAALNVKNNPIPFNGRVELHFCLRRFFKELSWVHAWR